VVGIGSGLDGTRKSAVVANNSNTVVRIFL
jgi:hypothetical protein